MKAKPTPGPWLMDSRDEENRKYPETVVGYPIFSIVNGDERLVACVCNQWVTNKSVDEFTKNVELIAEAGTVYHETGLTPRELKNKLDVATGLWQSIERDKADLRTNFNKLVEALGWSFEKVSMYDEEGVEGWKWTSPTGQEYHEIGQWDEAPPVPDGVLTQVSALKEQRDELLKVLKKVQQDINWMTNEDKLLSRFVFDYVDKAIEN